MARLLAPALLLASLWACRPVREPKPLFYYDLGPDSVDVSSYPPEARRGYDVFREKCSACHTLARALNSPHVDPRIWQGYYQKMVFRGGFTGKMPLDGKEYEAIAVFLDHDIRARKVGRKEEFLKQQEELQLRFLKLGP